MVTEKSSYYPSMRRSAATLSASKRRGQNRSGSLPQGVGHLVLSPTPSKRIDCEGQALLIRLPKTADFRTNMRKALERCFASCRARRQFPLGRRSTGADLEKQCSLDRQAVRGAAPEGGPRSAAFFGTSLGGRPRLMPQYVHCSSICRLSPLGVLSRQFVTSVPSDTYAITSVSAGITHPIKTKPLMHMDNFEMALFRCMKYLTLFGYFHPS